MNITHGTKDALFLLAGCSALALIAPAAHAQSQAPATVPADESTTDEPKDADIVVLGFGQTRQVQSISAADISLLTPGTSPLKAISKLPSVNFQSADPFGAYEWSTRISLRGFNQNQLGFTLDGVPLGDMSYGNYNGLHISRAIISENLGNVTVSQGSGALGTASSSNLGGTFEFSSRDPSADHELVGSITYGDANTVRAFIRGETGDLGGVRAYFSYGRLDAGKWRGNGAQRQDQFNTKVVADIGKAKLTALFDFSDRRENDYQDLSLGLINRLGYFSDNFAPNWRLAYQVAAIYQNQQAAAGAVLPYPTYGTTFPSPIQTVDDSYYDASGLRQDYLGSLKAEVPIGEAVKFTLQGYYHANHGQGTWWTPYTPSPTGAPISVRTTEYDIRRGGVIANLTYDLGFNHFEVGGWYERNAFRQARRFYALENTLAGSSRSSLSFQSNPFATQWYQQFYTDTVLYYVSDKIDIGSLTLSGGWKGLQVINNASSLSAGPLANGRISTSDWFLPQIGALYHVTDNVETYLSYTENTRAFVSAATNGPFSTTQLGFDTIRDTLKPEKSKTVEGGLRLRHGPLQASLAGYFVDFSNRLLVIPTSVGIVGSANALANVGSVHSSGIDVAVNYRPLPHLTLTGSYAYNDTTYQDDVVFTIGGVTTRLPVKGKTAVDTPHHIASAEVAYDGPIFFGRAGLNYQSKRYFSYLNDQSVGGRVLVDASIGVKVPEGHGYLTGVALEVSATNLFDKRYISTVGTNGFGFSGDNQTLLTGAPQQFFVTLRKGF